MSGSPLSPWRLLAGLAAIAAIAGMGLLVLPGWSTVRVPALVEAARTFTLLSIEPGRYHWSLRDGSTARGGGLIRQKHLGFEQTELVELELTPTLGTGDQVTAGTALAELRSLRSSRRTAELQATRKALVSRRALLAAGGRPAEVIEAGKRVEVARAELAKERAVEHRLTALQQQGLASAEELQTQEQLVEIRRLEVELAEAGEGVVRSPERDEALSQVDAQVAAIDSELQELQALADEGTVESPIDGVLQLGGNGIELQVFDLSQAYLRIPMPAEHRQALVPGAALTFAAPSLVTTTCAAEIVDIAVEASPLDRSTVFWVSARLLDQPPLQPGVTGVVTMTAEHSGTGLLHQLRHFFLGRQP